MRLQDKLIKTDLYSVLLRFPDCSSLWTTLTETQIELFKKNKLAEIVVVEKLYDDYSTDGGEKRCKNRQRNR